MKTINFITFMLLISASLLVNAAGNHSVGHGHADHNERITHWMAPATEAARHNPIKTSSESIKQGARLYRHNCMSCHGENATGNGKAGLKLKPRPSNLRVMAGTHPDGDFAYKINTGRGAMPAWKNTLHDNQVWHLVNFIQSLDKNSVDLKEGKHDHADGHKHGP